MPTADSVAGVLLVTLPAMVVNRGLADPHSLAWPLVIPAIALNLAPAVYPATTWRRLGSSDSCAGPAADRAACRSGVRL